MIYITQLIYVKPGKEVIFQEFENHVIPLMEEYTGKLISRVRPNKETYIAGEGQRPYEIHFISFASEADLANFLKDERRQEQVHLKEASIESVLLVKGEKM